MKRHRFLGRQTDLPTRYLRGPWDGGPPDRRESDVSRRLLRLKKALPLKLLDEQWWELARRPHCEPDELARLEKALCDLEAQYGDPRWLGYMQPIFLDGKPAANADGQPNKRWILLVNPRYLSGGSGPVGHDTSTMVYSHEHGGLLASIDDENRDNLAQTLWVFRTLEDVGNADAATNYAGTAPFQIHSRTGTVLGVNDADEFELADADIAVVPVWAELAALIRGLAGWLDTNGRSRVSPTWDPDGTLSAPAIARKSKIDTPMSKLMRLRAKRLSAYMRDWRHTKRTLLGSLTVDEAVDQKFDWAVIDETLADAEATVTVPKMLHHGPIFLEQSDPDHFIVLEELLIGHTYSGPVMANGIVTIVDGRTNTKLGTNDSQYSPYKVELGPGQGQEFDCIAAGPEDTLRLRLRRLGDDHVFTLDDLRNPVGPKAAPQTIATISATKEQFARSGHTGFRKIILEPRVRPRSGCPKVLSS